MTNEAHRYARATTRTVAAVLAAAGALLAGALPATAQWRYPHSNAANSGFARVDTLPALSPRVQIAGPVAPGANPVIGPDGTVYIGTMDGVLHAYHADGSTYWTRKVGPEHGGFYGSPVMGKDGTIYIVSSIYMDQSPNKVNESFLHRFLSGGAWLGWERFPKSALYPFTDGGLTNAFPNIWQWNGTEVIVIPAKYKGLGREDVSLLAFSATGGLIARKQVSVEVYEITGGPDLKAWAPYCFALNLWNLEVGCIVTLAIADSLGFKTPVASVPLAGAGFPLPGVAILPDPWGGPPRVAMTDGRHDKVVYNFSLQNGFAQVVRTTDPNRRFTTAPVQLPDGSTVVGTFEGVLTKTQLNLLEGQSFSGFGKMTATPARHKGGDVIVVSREGIVSKLGTGILRTAVGAETIASAASSCTHVFVTARNGFFTYDAATMNQVAVYPWTNAGGLSSPVIGPKGQVYAIVDKYLFVFAAPATGGSGPTACDVFPTL